MYIINIRGAELLKSIILEDKTRLKTGEYINQIYASSDYTQ
jgi:hypothetical protein